MHEKPQSSGTRSILNAIALCFLLASFCLYPALRIPQMGHLLTWDEAMNICSVRSLASMGSDDFSNWFWRHPPLYAVLMLTLAPLRSGFIQRVESLNIALGLINIMLLYLLNRRLFGRLTASISVFLLSIMPGSIFFDLWIKRDHLAITFALLALYLLASKKLTAASLIAGLGFLAKETFVFLYVPIFLSAVTPRCSLKRRVGRSLLIIVIPLLASFWWFIIASRSGSLSSITDHISFATAAGNSWDGGILFYAKLLLALIGPLGLLLMGAGILTALADAPLRGARAYIWPVSGIIVPLLLLTSISRKVPWIIIVLLPCIATAQALALTKGVELIRKHSRRKVTPIFASLACAALLALPSFSHSHETMLQEVSPDQYRGATRSRNIARAASNLIKSEDRLLLSAFHYWKGAVPGQMCPVFTCYFEAKPAVLPIPYDAPFELMVQLISDNQLNWAIVSPAPGQNAQDVLGGFINDAQLRPADTGYACIFDTSDLLTEPESSALDELPETAE